MDITTFAQIFSGSPFRPLSQHRDKVLESMTFLNHQLKNIHISQQAWLGRPDWLSELPRQLERMEQDVLARLQKPSLTALPKDTLQTILQTQCNLAHLVCRLAERLSYRPLELTQEQQQHMRSLCHYFGKAAYLLRRGVTELEALSKAGFRKQHTQSALHIRQQMTCYTDELRQSSSDLRSLICQQEKKMKPVDIALLFMTLDDIHELTLWMRALVDQMQPGN